MPTYQVTAPDGRKVKLTGDSPPTEAELEQIFASLPAAQERGVLDEVAGGLETAGTILSGAIAEPIAGIAGLGAGALEEITTLGQGSGSDAAANAVRATREALTMTPETPEAQRNLQAVSDFIAPAAEAFGAVEDVLGESTLEATGSPALAAAAKTIPTALLEIAGGGTLSKVSKIKSGRALDQAIKEAAPSASDLKDSARQVFKEIDEIGVTVEPRQFQRLSKKIETAARKQGARKRTTPEQYGVVEEFLDMADDGNPVTLDELYELREVAQNATDVTNAKKNAVAVRIIDEIDDFLDEKGGAILTKPEGAPNIGQEYKRARQLYGRAKKSEAIDDLFIAARDTASGFENGLRIEARKLLKNKNRSKFFNAQEKDALRQISEGTKASNLAKFVGRLGLVEGQAVNALNPLVGGGVAFAAGGPLATVSVLGIGQLSKNLAQKLTKNNAKFADQVVRAGNNAEIITKAYLNNVPKGQRSALELSELLMRNEVDLSTAKSAFARDAAETAKEFRRSLEGQAIGGSLAPREDEDG